jgi:hypothetical protein
MPENIPSTEQPSFTDELPTPPKLKSGERPIGMYKGQIDIGPEFFEPLPKEELALWNCEGDDSHL